MKPKVLKTARDHQVALAHVADLMAQPIPDETELERWSLLVVQYEEVHFPIAVSHQTATQPSKNRPG